MDDGFRHLGEFLLLGANAVTSATAAGLSLWLLGFVFLFSGSSKLRKPALVAMALIDFGVTRKLIPLASVALGGVEVVLAIGLMFRVALPLPAIVACALLSIFCFAIGRSLIHGKRFPCYCFGDSNDQLGIWTLIRSGALTIVALVAVEGSSDMAISFWEWLVLGVVSAALGATLWLAAKIPLLFRLNSEWIDA